MVVVLVGSLTLILYTFVGYPAVVALLARLVPRPVRSEPAYEPTVSLIVVAYNEADVIEAKLANTRDLDYPPDKLEVIVAADGSDDETVLRAERTPGTKVLHQPERRGKLEAMNRAAAAAGGEIMVFSDANNHYTPGTLRALVSPFADPGVGVVTGRKAIDDGEGRPLDRAEGLYWRYESKIKTWETTVGSVAAVAGEILAFRRQAYPSSLRGVLNEDFVQAMVAAAHGWRVVYAPDAVSLERASATLGDEATRRSRLVTGRLQAMREVMPAMVLKRPWYVCQVVSHKGLRPAVPWALLVAGVSNVAVACRRPWARPLLALQTVFYAGAVGGLVNERRGRRHALLYLPYYFCRMNVASLTGLRNFLGPRPQVAWEKVRRA